MYFVYIAPFVPQFVIETESIWF